MRDFTVFLRRGGEKSGPATYLLQTRNACRARDIALSLLQREGGASADIYEAGALVGTLTAPG